MFLCIAPPLPPVEMATTYIQKMTPSPWMVHTFYFKYSMLSIVPDFVFYVYTYTMRTFF